MMIGGEMDFSSLSVPKASAPPTDPFKIFAALPRVQGAPNDLWRGQGEALSRWNVDRKRSDIQIGLNTGAGKTIVGLLIAKSFVNEGLENVLYVCPTIDLVLQTAKQAMSIESQIDWSNCSEELIGEANGRVSSRAGAAARLCVK
jgi:replicative superfamily II helicase